MKEFYQVLRGTSSSLASALRYAQTGFCVLPLVTVRTDGSCSCGRSNCTAPGKHPRISNWRREASNDPKIIDHWWRQWPLAGIGVATGEISNLLVIDVDPRHDGDESLKKLESAFGELPRTNLVRTGGGGLHFYLRYPGLEVRNSSSNLAPGIDVRAEGGLVVAPPSLHISGEAYEWISREPESLAEIPAKWLELLRRESREAITDPTVDETAKITEGKRHTTLTSLAGSLRNTGLGTAAIKAALIEVNQERCEPPVPVDEIDRIAKDIGAKPMRRKSQASGNQDEIYTKGHDGLYVYRMMRNLRAAVRLTNFNCEIVATMAHDDGVEVSRRLELETKLSDRTQRLIIPSAEFSNMRWVTERLGPGAIVYAGNGNIDHARCAIQVLSRGRLEERVIYAHTGWRRLGDEWSYLHAGGAIDQNGSRAGIEVDLPDALSRFILPNPPVDEELVASIRASLDLVGMGPERVMIPILSATYRASLGNCDFALHLAGPTGVFKSEIAAIAQQHFGADFSRLHLPGAWSATANSLEGLCFTAKDAVVVVDDFAPTGTTYDRQRFHREADRLFRAQGNSAGRMRMKADLTLRPSRPPRGLILSTGEDIPGGHSLRARILVLELARGEIDAGKLSAAQIAGAGASYAKAMAGFFRWLAPQLDEVRSLLKEESAGHRLRASREGDHARTPGIVADLFAGWKAFLGFAKESNALSELERADLEARGWTAICEATASQSRHQEAQEPARRFIELLSSAIASGDAHVATMIGGPPEPPEAWGWRMEERGDNVNYEPRGRRVGWLDEEDLYLDPDASFRVVQSQAGPGGELQILAQTLRKRLHESGLLVSVDHKRETLAIRRTIESRQRNVLHLSADSLGFKIETGPLKGPGDARKEF